MNTIENDEYVDATFKPISNAASFALWLFVCLGLPGIILCAFWVNGYLGFKL